MASLRRQIGAQSVSRTEIELYAKLAKLRRRVQSLQAVMCLLLALVRVTGCLSWLLRRSASSRRHLVVMMKSFENWNGHDGSPL